MSISKNEGIPTGTSLEALTRLFVLTCRTDGKSPVTVKYYRENLGRLLWYARDQNWPTDTRDLTEWHARSFLDYVATTSSRWGRTGNGSESCRKLPEPMTVYRYYTVLRAFFAWCTDQGFLQQNPIARMKRKPPRPKVVQPYEPADLLKMLDVCDLDSKRNARFLGSRNKAVVLMLLDTGLRISELASVTLGDVDLNTGRIKVIGKGAKERVVKMSATCLKALVRYLACRPAVETGGLWLTEEHTQMKTEGIQMMIRRLKQRADVQGPGSCHRFRNTFAMSFLEHGGSPLDLQYLLGHEDLAMVRHYTRAAQCENALRAHDTASPADALLNGRKSLGR